MSDLLIIGAGLSGLTAALTAARAGMSVTVVAKGLGSIHWSAGTIDLLGYLPQVHQEAVDFPLAAIERLPSTHPYRLVEASARQLALDEFLRVTADVGLTYTGATVRGRNLMLPSPIGAVRPTYLAPRGQIGGDLASDQPMVIVGFEGMRDFYPALIAENLRTQGHAARAAFLPLAVLTSRHDSNTVHLASEVDRPPVHNRLGAALAKVVRTGERIGLPAVLGLERHAEVLASLTERTGATLFEIPTLPPSVPGIRLHRALRNALSALGVRVEAGMEAIGYGSRARQVEWVETETSARPLRHRASHFLLATGGILGGGFDSDHKGTFREVIFDLPLTVPQDRRQWFRPEFLDPAGQPVFNGGVAASRPLQPMDETGRPIFANLWVAGGLLAHSDPIQERSLEGMAIITGSWAATSIVGHHSGRSSTEHP